MTRLAAAAHKMERRGELLFIDQITEITIVLAVVFLFLVTKLRTSPLVSFDVFMDHLRQASEVNAISDFRVNNRGGLPSRLRRPAAMSKAAKNSALLFLRWVFPQCSQEVLGAAGNALKIASGS